MHIRSTQSSLHDGILDRLHHNSVRVYRLPLREHILSRLSNTLESDERANEQPKSNRGYQDS